MTSVIFSNGVTCIESQAFYQCSNLTSITIPCSVTSIDMLAFADCSSLASIVVESGNSKYDSRENCNAIIETSTNTLIQGCKNTIIPNSVTSIGFDAFYGCSGLTSFTIPNNVTSIGGSAFMHTDLTLISIGSGINKIYNSAFSYCSELKDVYCYAENVPSTEMDVFNNTPVGNVTLHVPESSVNDYMATRPWRHFKDIVKIDMPEPQKCAKPSITYQNGQLKMNCATDGVQFVTDITDTDVKKHYDQTISLTATYNVSVYATKSGYENSDVSTVTLCWIDQAPAISTGSVNVPALPILIKSEDGWLTVEGADDGTQVSVYTLDGMQVGSTVSCQGSAVVGTNLNAGNAAIVKVGNKSVKVIMK